MKSGKYYNYSIIECRLYHKNSALSIKHTPALGVSVKSVRLVAGRLRFCSRSGYTKDFKNSIRSFCARRSAPAEVRRVLCMCCSSCMFLNSDQSFVVHNCNGPPIENGLNNMCLHSLSRTHFYVMYPAPAEPCFFLTKRGFMNAILY